MSTRSCVEDFGKSYGWLVGVVGVVLSAVGVSVAGCNLSQTIDRSGADLARSERAQHEQGDFQALSILSGNPGLGTRAALRLVVREGLDVSDLRVQGADLERADLSGLKAEHAAFDGANLGGARLARAQVQDASFAHSDLSGADLRELGVRPRPAEAISVEPEAVARRRRDPTRVIVHKGSYGIRFDFGNLIGAALDGARLAGASFANADLTDSTFSGADLARADFTGADTRNTDFSGADFGSGAMAAHVTQAQLDAACTTPLLPAMVPDGLVSPKRACPPR